jgi:hypothetical protein
MMTHLLDRPIAFHRSFVALGVGITGALMLSQAIYWSKRTQRGDGWFYKTQADWEEETGLSRYEQESARKKLRNAGFLLEDKRGIPCKTWYKIDISAVENALTKYAENQQTGAGKTSEQCSGKPTSSAVENQRTNTETTQRLPETTTENISDSEKPVSESSIAEKPTSAKKPKPKKKTNDKYSIAGLDFSSWPNMPSEQIMNDWLKTRKTLGAPITQTVINRFGAQLSIAVNAGFSVDSCLGLAIERGWRGLNAEWVINALGGAAGMKKAGALRGGTAGIDYHSGVGKDGKF